MIRINILRNRGGTSALKTSVTSMTGITFSGSDGSGDSGYADEKSVMIKKIVMALVFPILIIGYDQYAKSEKRSVLSRIKWIRIASVNRNTDSATSALRGSNISQTLHISRPPQVNIGRSVRAVWLMPSREL